MTAYAQNVTMTGTVVDTDNLPLIGVNVVIKVLLPVLLLIWMVSLLLLEKMDKHWFLIYRDDPPRDCLQGKTFARDNEG